MYALTDHPRSRGVYAATSLMNLSTVGSSPLARGLRAPHQNYWWGARIIPARAGFTRAGTVSSGALMDHPRSRGVYPASSRDHFSVSGSSPLARGLHPENLLGGIHRRIIPARAGFTCTG